MFPNVVEMLVPSGGLGQTTEAIRSFHESRGILCRYGISKRMGKKNFVRLCFAKLDEASLVIAKIGDKLVEARQ